MLKSIGANLTKRLKNSLGNIANQKMKRRMMQAVPFWFASVITGLVAVAYSKLFLWADWIARQLFLLGPGVLFVVTPLSFLFAWWIVRRFSPFSAGSGIPQVAAAIEIAGPRTDHKVNKLLGLKVIIVKLISSLSMAAGGAAIGREGPTIQIAASIFYSINNALPKWWPKVAKSNMITAGAAAGLAAAFNTPLGGIVFAIEELTKTHFSYFKTAIFSSVIVAGLTAQALLGSYLYLGYPKIDGLSNFIIFSVMLVALIAGVLGASLSRLILKVLNWKETFKLKRHHFLFLLGCSMCLVALATFVDFDTLGSGKHIMEKSLFSADKHVAWYIPLLRMIGPLLSFTSGAAGGIFAPALAAGASVGAVFAEWLNFNDTNTNLLILAGMAAFLTGVTRSPFTSAILVLEMTNKNNTIFYLIIAGMIASLVAMLVDKHSLYDHLKINYIKKIDASLEKEH